jgi:predicted permease
MLSELWSDLRYRLRALFRRADLDRELDDELRFHLEREAEKYSQTGVAPNEARRRARIAFGGIDAAKEESRESRGTARFDTLTRDLRYAARSLGQHRAFSITVVLTLALGIGANTTIFTLVDALLLRELPVPRPNELVTIGDPAAVNSRWTGSPGTDYVSYPLYLDVRDRNDVLSSVYANGSIGDVDVRVGTGDDHGIEHPETRLVSGNFFSTLEIAAREGRVFTPDDDEIDAPNAVAVISDSYWRRRFGGERSAIGQTIRVDDVPVTIIGVMAPSFQGDIVGQPTDLWLPITLQARLQPRANRLRNREVSWLVLMGRLSPGVSIEKARAVIPAIEAAAVRAQIAGIHLQRFNEDLAASPIRVEPGARGFSQHREVYGHALVMLMAAVALVILVVCANVGNLMLTRSLARAREMTVRMSLGASRGRLVQQLLTESVVLAVVGGVLGLLLALWGSRVLLAIAGGDPPVVLDVMPNGAVLAFTAAATLVCAGLFGLVPAFRVTRVDLATTLRAHARALMGAHGGGRVPLAKLLVVAQVALSTILLVGSALLVRSMSALLRTDLGLDRDHLVVGHVATGRTSYAGARLAAFRQELLERARSVPGVDAASYSSGGPFAGGHSSGHVTVPGFVAQADSEGEIYYDHVGPDYLHAIGARLLRGRDFSAADIASHARVGVIDGTMAKYYFRNRDPIGRTVSLDSESYSIVGVVRDVQYNDLRAAPVRRLYMPYADTAELPRSFELQIHVRGQPARFVQAVRQALGAADPTVPIELSPLDERVRGSVSQDALLVQVTTFFGLIALLLAALGLYGTTAYATTMRTGEFGLRVALGAAPGRVLWMVLGDTVRVALVGVAVGLPAGLLATRALRGTLYGVSPGDPLSLGAAVATLVVTAVLASYLPASRAAKVSPLEALRVDG